MPRNKTLLPLGCVDLHTDLGLMEPVRENNVRQRVALAREEQSPNTDSGVLRTLKRLTSI